MKAISIEFWFENYTSSLRSRSFVIIHKLIPKCVIVKLYRKRGLKQYNNNNNNFFLIIIIIFKIYIALIRWEVHAKRFTKIAKHWVQSYYCAYESFAHTHAASNTEHSFVSYVQPKREDCLTAVGGLQVYEFTNHFFK